MIIATAAGLLAHLGLEDNPINTLAAILFVFGGFDGSDWATLKGKA